MQEEEKRPQPQPKTWELKDPKPPVVQSGRMENRRAH